jgi:hypothetical protein
MEADSLFFKGTSHALCEDYATHWLEPNLAAAIVCDGCSSSQKSDVGARLLAEAFLACLKTDRPLQKEDAEFIPYLQASLNYRLRSLSNLLHLPEEALDATLLAAVAFPNTKQLLLFLYGDGHIIYRTKSEETFILSKHYPSGAPYYINYLLRLKRAEAYREQFGPPDSETTLTHFTKEGETTITHLENHAHHTFCLPLDTLEWVAVFSDGADTFQTPNHEGTLPAQQILTELTAYKTLEGEYVKRRMNRFQKEAHKVGKSHFDDLACAGLAFPKPQSQDEQHA